MTTARDKRIVHRRPPAARRIYVAGTGSCVPERVLRNSDLEKMVDTTDEWIFTRSGIRERRIAADGQASSDLGAAAAIRALEAASVAAADVDLIIVGTVTPDMIFPNTACFVQNAIQAKNAVCFDLEAACSGFLYGVEVAEHFLSSGTMNTALVIGAEKLSTVTDWRDRATCVLFGDGAGAVVLKTGGDRRGIINSVMGSDGSLTDLLNIPAGGSRHPTTQDTVEKGLHYMKMMGREVFKHAVRAMSDSAVRVLERSGLTL